jgi:hypothetical protein
MSDPVILNVKRSGLGLDVSVQKSKMTGLTVDYQRKASAADVAPVLQVIEGAMSKHSPRGGVVPLLVEGIASLDRGDKGLSKHPTVMNVRSSSIKMGITLRRNRVTGLSIDYQKTSNGNEIGELIKVLNKICSGEDLPSAEKAEPRLLPIDLGSEKAAEVLDDRYREIIIQVAQESLGMLGEQGKQTVLAFLEKRYGLGIEMVPKHYRAFIDLLRQVVGKGAADAIEKDMVSCIKNKIPASGETLREVIRSLGVKAEGEVPPRGAEAEGAHIVVEDARSQERPLEIPTVSLSFKLSDRASEHSA